jgi:protocatechuate 3,4-dioxygenase beta subunit
MKFKIFVIAKLSIIALYGSIHSFTALAEPLAADRFVADCLKTPAISRYPYPGRDNIYPSGKMARPAGKPDYAADELLYVHGRIFDSACVPLKNAKIELWHADSAGRYRYAKSGELSNPYPVFTGGGMVYSDNNGEFMFETIMPEAPAGDQAPYLNIRISHDLMRGGLQSAIYFAGESRNEMDQAYRKLSATTKQQITVPLENYEAKPSPINSLDYSVDRKNNEMADGALPKGKILHYDITVNARDSFRKF